MAAKIYKATCAAGNAVKIFTNDTGKDVVATLNAVSQTATANPKINVAISSDKNVAINQVSTSHTTTTNSGSPASLALLSNGQDYWGMNTTSGVKGLIANVDGSALTNSYQSTDFPAAMQFCEPYYFLQPRLYDTSCTDALPFCFLTNPTSNTFHYFKDATNVLQAGDGSFMAGNGVAGGDHTSSCSYYQYGWTWDAYTNTFVGINGNAYLSAGHAYSTGITSSNASSGSVAYSLYSSSYGGYYGSASDTDNYPWCPSISVDAGMYHISGGNQSYNMLFKVFNQTGADNFFNNYPSWTRRVALWSTTPWSSNNYFRYNLDNSERFRWIKWNPHTSKYYIYIDKTESDGGIYSFDDFLPTTSVAGHNTDIETISAWTSETTNIPSGKMTKPARIGNSLWLSYDDSANAYFTTDLLNYKTLAEHSKTSSRISNATIVNEDANGNEFFGNSANSNVQQFSSGYDSVDKAGFLENNTEIGAFERSGIIIPQNESIYVENIDSTADISVSLMTVDI